MTERIDILLATYNGSQYLAALLDSILAQTYRDWRLIVRDDGSVDETMKILEHYGCMDEIDFTLIPGDGRNLGACGSFSELLVHSDADYAVFCDQDDVWKSDKLRVQLDAIKTLEKRHGKETPILVHTDLEVVDESLETLDQSFWRYQNLNPAVMQKFERLLVQNCVTGCACMFNSSLRRRASPIPKGAIMHDWWFALVAVSTGVIHELDTTTVKYRQHGTNRLGAHRWGISYICRMLVKRAEFFREGFDATYRQAKGLLESVELDDAVREIAMRYIQLPKSGFFKRRYIIIRNGFRKAGFIRGMAYILWG